MKKLLNIKRTNEGHWVGDGFPVRTIFSYNDTGKTLSPFLLMDYAGPVEFSPSDHRRGVGEHPHRGFETVTIVYDGQVEHRDSAGGGGVIGPGDVQWMTAASGLVHEEKHGKEFAAKGGRFEMVQLWVNLPTIHKMTKPKYQGIKNEQIPQVELAGGSVRVIAGEFKDAKGPASTFTPINLWDVRLNRGGEAALKVPAGHNASLFVLNGQIKLDSGQTLGEADLAILDPQGDEIAFSATEDAKLLFLGGEVINESVVGYGPFVMNTPDEIRQAFTDFSQGKMGKIGPIEGSDT